LEHLCLWKKRQFLRLTEISELTAQLARALDSKDQVSVRMVLSMRQDPIRQAEELEQNMRSYLLTLPEEDAIRLNAILDGAEPKTQEEIPLCEQVGRNRRLLQEITQRDRSLSVRLGGNKSFYRMFRDG